MFPDLLAPISAREESAGLGHLMSELSLGAQVECQSGDAEDDGHADGGVRFPVGGLRIPATGRRPDVLGVRDSRTTTHLAVV